MLKNKIKGILFDMGEVLVAHTVPDMLKLFVKRLAEKFGLDIRKTELILRKVTRLRQLGKEQGIYKQLGIKLGIKNVNLRKLNSLSMQNYTRHTRPNKETLSLVKRLKKKYKLGVLSNTNRISVAVNRRRGIFRDFDVLVFSCEVKSVKPQRKIYRVAAKKMKLSPQTLLFIDDKLENVKAARKFGMKAIHFHSFPQLKRDLKKLNILW